MLDSGIRDISMVMGFDDSAFFALPEGTFLHEGTKDLHCAINTSIRSVLMS